MAKAGGSAQHQYERLAARRRAELVPRLMRNTGTFGAAGAFLWVITATGGYGWGPWLFLMMVGIGLLKTFTEPAHVVAWAIGAKGERVTEAALDRLPVGFIQLHDRRIPGSRANIDHIVIGPTGVFVVESKRMRGKLRVRGDTVIIRGRRTAMVDEVRREADAVQAALVAMGKSELVAQPLLYIQGVDPPWFLSQPAGVPIALGGRKLRRLITSGPVVLNSLESDAIARELDQRLERMVHEPAEAPPAAEVASPADGRVLSACPRCGNDMVLRRNRQGAAFLGCSQFPKCRGTRPAGTHG